MTPRLLAEDPGVSLGVQGHFFFALAMGAEYQSPCLGRLSYRILCSIDVGPLLHLEQVALYALLQDPGYHKLRESCSNSV